MKTNRNIIIHQNYGDFLDKLPNENEKKYWTSIVFQFEIIFERIAQIYF